jgi:hypothetical protein
LAQPFGHLHARVQVGIGQQRGELLTTKTAQHVAVTQRTGHQLGGLPQHLVAHHVGMQRSLICLKWSRSIIISKTWRLADSGAFVGRLQPTPVGNARERIGGGHSGLSCSKVMLRPALCSRSSAFSCRNVCASSVAFSSASRVVKGHVLIAQHHGVMAA